MLHSFILFFVLFAFADQLLLKIRLYDPATVDEKDDSMLGYISEEEQSFKGLDDIPYVAKGHTSKVKPTV